MPQRFCKFRPRLLCESGIRCCHGWPPRHHDGQNNDDKSGDDDIDPTFHGFTPNPVGIPSDCNHVTSAMTATATTNAKTHFIGSLSFRFCTVHLHKLGDDNLQSIRPDGAQHRRERPVGIGVHLHSE